MASKNTEVALSVLADFWPNESADCRFPVLFLIWEIEIVECITALFQKNLEVVGLSCRWGFLRPLVFYSAAGV